MDIQGYDVFMLIVLVAAVAWGAWKGLAWQIASIASLAVSYMVSLNFRQPLSQLIQATPPWNMFLAMLILFLGTSLVVWVGFNFVSEMIERVKLKEFDRQVGALFGLAKGAILCVLITLFAVTLMSEPQRQAICNSRSGYYIALALDRAHGIMPPEVHQVLDPYIRELDDRVDTPPDQPATDPIWSQPFRGVGENPPSLVPTPWRSSNSNPIAPQPFGNRPGIQAAPAQPSFPSYNENRQADRYREAY